MKRISDVDVEGKTVVIRIDINMPVKNSKVEINKRVIEHSKTLKDLSERGAKLVVLGHQGNKGKSDFVSLKEHSKILEGILNKPVCFDDLKDWNFTNKRILSMKNGDILLLENTRFDSEEKGSPFSAKFIEKLSILGDYFVLDALSVAHRNHASVVGLTKHLKSFMGNVLEVEINALEKLRSKKKITFVIGGAKVEDSIKIVKYWINRGNVERILFGGVPSILFLKAKFGSSVICGKNEEYLEKINGNMYLDMAKKLINSDIGEKLIVLPSDVMVENKNKFGENTFDNVILSKDNFISGSIKDIGKKSSENYYNYLLDAETIVMNGPLGVYEQRGFENGTLRILEGIIKNKGYSIIGGGHTLSAINKFGIREDNFSYVSLSGKAFLQYLSGKELPGLVALKQK